MPELPEVQTTVNGLKKIIGLKIEDIWTDYKSTYHLKKDNIKNPEYFSFFKKSVIGSKIIGTERIGKNVIIHLDNGYSMLTHMKMTGHYLYGKYSYSKKENRWIPSENGPLADPFNRFIRLIFSLSNGMHLAFSDTRRFAKIVLINSKKLKEFEDIRKLGPDPLNENLNKKEFLTLIKESGKNKKIKTVLLDQEIISGIGNIYSDEILWRSSIHPESISNKIPDSKIYILYGNMRKILKEGINFGGDSMSDYRNIDGEKGSFQERHMVYRKKGKICNKKEKSGKKHRVCDGIIERKAVGPRNSHFCPKHQELFS